MSLSNKDLLSLSNFLLPERIARQTLETITGLVNKQFAKSEHFKICQILVFLLQNDFLCDALSRFTALFLVWEMYKSDLITLNPFAQFLVTYLRDEFTTKLPSCAVYVFHTLLTQPEQIHEFIKYTPLQILSLQTNGAANNLDWSFLQPESQESSRLPKKATCGFPCIVADKDVTPSLANELPTPVALPRQCLESLLSHNEPIACHTSLRPEYLRVAPPLLPCPQGVEKQVDLDEASKELTTSSSPDRVNKPKITSGWQEELIWLNPNTLVHEFHWDASTEQANPTTELRQLMSMALTASLPQPQQHTVIQAITDNPSLVPNLGVTPENLPSLVNCNPVIAIEVLQLLVNSPQKEDYYKALVSMDLTVHSMEVVNRLTSKVEWPPEFTHRYISNCMQSCQSIPDKSLQQRHVRLVCVLIRSLICNKILDIHNENILVEVQTFCLEFNKVADARNLYRLIKNTQNSASGSVTSPNQSDGNNK
ncbi:unnamed protein product [Calicophoron daubneyi]